MSLIERLKAVAYKFKKTAHYEENK